MGDMFQRGVSLQPSRPWVPLSESSLAVLVIVRCWILVISQWIRVSIRSILF